MFASSNYNRYFLERIVSAADISDIRPEEIQEFQDRFISGGAHFRSGFFEGQNYREYYGEVVAHILAEELSGDEEINPNRYNVFRINEDYSVQLFERVLYPMTMGKIHSRFLGLFPRTN